MVQQSMLADQQNKQAGWVQVGRLAGCKLASWTGNHTRLAGSAIKDASRAGNTSKVLGHAGDTKSKLACPGLGGSTSKLAEASKLPAAAIVCVR